MNWQSIYRNIENKQWAIGNERKKQGIGSNGGFDGIAVLSDPLALEWQRLERINKHVGCHYCAQRDRLHGMKSAKCFYATRKD